MPITVAEGTRVLQAYGIQATRNPKLTRQPILGGTAVSQRGKDIQHAIEAIAALPDVRLDRIADMKRRIAEGYSIDCSAIAEKMIYQGIADRLR